MAYTATSPQSDLALSAPPYVTVFASMLRERNMWNKDDLIKNLTVTLGEKWVEHICQGLVAIVVDVVPGCYDSTQKVVFIDSRQTESEATQQLIMELSNHQNRNIFAEIDAAAGTMTRDKYVERVEELEFAGVQNVIRSYDKAESNGDSWAKGGCVYGAVRGGSFADYYGHVSVEHRERYGKRYDKLRGG